MANLSDALDKARKHLAHNEVSKAMEVLMAESRSGSKAAVNAYSVCLLRTGRYDEAVKLLRGLVYPGNSFAIAPNLPMDVKVNFATALMLSGNIDGGLIVLKQMDGEANPALDRLRSTVDRWRRSLTLFQRLQRLWTTPAKPVPFDFPPGDF